jgi:radical SAM protein with 4Fe4S-binding SPASM domain
MFDTSRLVSELTAYGCKQLYIQGGDPFLERDILYALVSTAVGRNLDILVQSPGVNLTEDDWKFVSETGLGLAVPVFGADGGTHDSVTGVSGSFKGLKDVLQRYRRDGSKSLTAKIILTKDTILQQDAIKKWLMEYGIQWISVDVFVSFDDSVNGNPAMKDVLLNLFKRAPSDFRVPMEAFFRLAKGHECWQDELAFTRSGEILPCIASRHHVIGEVTQESLLGILRSKCHFPFRDGGKDSFIPCSGCEFRYGCSSCSLVTERIVGTWQQRSWNCTYDPVLGEWSHPAIA